MMTVSMPASASHVRVLNAVSGLQRAAWSLFARVDSFGATLPLPSRLSVLSSASCVRIVDTAVTAHQDSLAQQALGLDRHFPSPAHSLAILPGGGAGSGASLRKLPVVLKEHHSPSFNPHALGAWAGAGGSSLLQAGGWLSGRSSSTLASSRATCSASASASTNNGGILSSCYVSTFTSGIARGYATAAATAEEPKAPGPKAPTASSSPTHTARPAVAAPAPAPTPAPVSAAAAVAPEPLSVTEFARHPPTGSYTITLRCYSLPPLAAPRPPAEQRVLEAALAVVRRLRAHGFTGMFAGGWVRDQFLGRPSPDIDIVTNASITEVYEVFRRDCKHKGAATMEVTADGLAFEVTSYRGGLVGDCEEAEWRDAAYRDFTCNALFFEPTLDEHVPQQQPQQPQQPQPQPQYQNASAAADTAAPSTSTTSTPDTTTSTPTPSTHTSTSTPTASARPAAPAAHLQPAGRVKDYVGGLVDLEARRLRVYGGHERLGLRTSSVEADPVRVLRAARLSVQLGLAVEAGGYTAARLRAAGPKCGISPEKGVSASRVWRELSKMAELDAVTAPVAPAAAAVPAAGAAEGSGGAKGSRGGGGGGGSPQLAAALELCLEWGALQALLPGVSQDVMARVLQHVLPRLPAAMPLELKLACLTAAPLLPYSTAGGSLGLVPWPRSDRPPPAYAAPRPDPYEPVVALLRETRAAAAPHAHLPHALGLLSHLLAHHREARTRQEAWRQLLATEGADLVLEAYCAFLSGRADLDWRRQLQRLVRGHKRKLLLQPPTAAPSSGTQHRLERAMQAAAASAEAEAEVAGAEATAAAGEGKPGQRQLPAQRQAQQDAQQDAQHGQQERQQRQARQQRQQWYGSGREQAQGGGGHGSGGGWQKRGDPPQQQQQQGQGQRPQHQGQGQPHRQQGQGHVGRHSHPHKHKHGNRKQQQQQQQQ